MSTLNPNDAINTQIIRRAKKVDKALSASIEIAKRYDLIPRQETLEFKVFVDERLQPIYVSEQEHKVAYGRRGKWITVREV